MIPRAHIIEWRATGRPWQTDAMVEQDLLLERVLVELFSDMEISRQLVFRGGTALHKLFFENPMRYSEDIDLVQREAGPIGPVFNRVRELLESWMGVPQRKQGPGLATMVFRIQSEDAPPQPLRVKVEINTREHFQALPLQAQRFEVSSRWFAGKAILPVYDLNELLATKLRALYQRRKGRDLFDLASALRSCSVDPSTIVSVCERYMKTEGHRITQKAYRDNLAAKMLHPGFRSDCPPLLRPGTPFDLEADWILVDRLLLSRLAETG
jgi:predicted nucleotidyltransferase component of viral defense system